MATGVRTECKGESILQFHVLIPLSVIISFRLVKAFLNDLGQKTHFSPTALFTHMALYVNNQQGKQEQEIKMVLELLNIHHDNQCWRSGG